MTTIIFLVLREIILDWSVCFFFEFLSIAFDCVSERVSAKKIWFQLTFWIFKLLFFEFFFYFFLDLSFFSCLLACTAIFMLYRKWCKVFKILFEILNSIVGWFEVTISGCKSCSKFDCSGPFCFRDLMFYGFSNFELKISKFGITNPVIEGCQGTLRSCRSCFQVWILKLS